MIGILDRLIEATRRISRIAVWMAGTILLASVALIATEVVLRRIGGLPLIGASEISGYMLAISSAWAFSHTLLSRSNIRFDSLYGRTPPRVRSLLDLIALVALAGFMLAVTRYCVTVFLTSLRLGAVSNSALSMPLWLPQGLWVAGLLFLCWTLVLLTLRSALALAAGDDAAVSALAGIEMPSEEIERETRGIIAPDAGPLARGSA